MFKFAVFLALFMAGTFADRVCNDRYFDPFNHGRKEWMLAFRGTANIAQSAYEAYKTGMSYESPEYGCQQVGKDLPCSQHFRNNEVLDKWHDIEEVALLLYKNNQMVKFVRFDAMGSNYMNWMNASMIKSSSWVDLKTASKNYFSIDGDMQHDRRFYMSHSHVQCPDMQGWMVVLDPLADSCTWESSSHLKPVIKYSKLPTYTNWNRDDSYVGEADYFAVLVKYFNIARVMGW